MRLNLNYGRRTRIPQYPLPPSSHPLPPSSTPPNGWGARFQGQMIGTPGMNGQVYFGDAYQYKQYLELRHAANTGLYPPRLLTPQGHPADLRTCSLARPTSLPFHGCVTGAGVTGGVTGGVTPSTSPCMPPQALPQLYTSGPTIGSYGYNTSSVTPQGCHSSSVTPQGCHTNSVTPQGCHTSSVTPQGCHSSSVTPQGCHTTSVTPQGCHSSSVTPQGCHTSSVTPQGCHTSSVTPQGCHITPHGSVTSSCGTAFPSLLISRVQTLQGSPSVLDSTADLTPPTSNNNMDVCPEEEEPELILPQIPDCTEPLKPVKTELEDPFTPPWDLDSILGAPSNINPDFDMYLGEEEPALDQSKVEDMLDSLDDPSDKTLEPESSVNLKLDLKQEPYPLPIKPEPEPYPLQIKQELEDPTESVPTPDTTPTKGAGDLQDSVSRFQHSFSCNRFFKLTEPCPHPKDLVSGDTKCVKRLGKRGRRVKQSSKKKGVLGTDNHILEQVMADTFLNTDQKSDQLFDENMFLAGAAVNCGMFPKSSRGLSRDYQHIVNCTSQDWGSSYVSVRILPNNNPPEKLPPSFTPPASSTINNASITGSSSPLSSASSAEPPSTDPPFCQPNTLLSLSSAPSTDPPFCQPNTLLSLPSEGLNDDVDFENEFLF